PCCPLVPPATPQVARVSAEPPRCCSSWIRLRPLLLFNLIVAAPAGFRHHPRSSLDLLRRWPDPATSGWIQSPGCYSSRRDSLVLEHERSLDPTHRWPIQRVSVSAGAASFRLSPLAGFPRSPSPSLSRGCPFGSLPGCRIALPPTADSVVVRPFAGACFPRLSRSVRVAGDHARPPVVCHLNPSVSSDLLLIGWFPDVLIVYNYNREELDRVDPAAYFGPRLVY
uniref:Uncharacterized protein n=1 Tax=Triticum urartu TaxID=4572 RepID=A0A8R7TFM5_TRIUA